MASPPSSKISGQISSPQSAQLTLTQPLSSSWAITATAAPTPARSLIFSSHFLLSTHIRPTSSSPETTISPSLLSSA
uniref:Uncharacterized protein n=1 Tax=Cannabis sativa TaxID=3483 RepID=A0A803RAQ6_CANSA